MAGSGYEILRSENNRGIGAPKKLEEIHFHKDKKPRKYHPKVMYEYRIADLDEYGKPKYKKLEKKS